MTTCYSCTALFERKKPSGWQYGGAGLRLRKVSVMGSITFRKARSVLFVL